MTLLVLKTIEGSFLSQFVFIMVMGQTDKYILTL